MKVGRIGSKLITLELSFLRATDSLLGLDMLWATRVGEDCNKRGGKMGERDRATLGYYIWDLTRTQYACRALPGAGVARKIIVATSDRRSPSRVGTNFFSESSHNVVPFLVFRRGLFFRPASMSSCHPPPSDVASTDSTPSSPIGPIFEGRGYVPEKAPGSVTEAWHALTVGGLVHNIP